MEKITRKILFFLFSGVFIVIAPLVVLYTAGYRLNFDQMSLVKTGLFYMSSEPKSATVILDGKNTNRETTTIFKNIMPGEYLVRLEKEGYLPWEKTLEVKENETTFVQEVRLFSTSEAVLKNSENFLTFTLSQNGEVVAWALDEGSWTEIWSQDLNSNDKKLLLRLPKNTFETLELAWIQKNGKNLLLVKEIKGVYEKWSLISQNGENESVDQTLLSQWQRDTNQLLFTEDTLQGTDLIRQDQNNSRQILASLPSGQYEFLPAPSSLVLLQEKNRDRIILVDDRGVTQPILLNTNAFAAAWNPQNDKQLLYASDFELHIFDAEKQSDSILTRVSKPIIDIAWHPSATNIFYADNNNLYALELDRRGGGYQIFNLITMDKIEAFAITANEKMIYLVGNKDSQTGIFERQLWK